MAGIGGTDKPEGQTKPSFVESAVYEQAVQSLRQIQVPLNWQERHEYSGGNPTYSGYAPRGVATSTAGWLLFKYTWSSGNMTVKQVAYDSWDNRASASYS